MFCSDGEAGVEDVEQGVDDQHPRGLTRTPVLEAQWQAECLQSTCHQTDGTQQSNILVKYKTAKDIRFCQFTFYMTTFSIGSDLNVLYPVSPKKCLFGIFKGISFSMLTFLQEI